MRSFKNSIPKVLLFNLIWNGLRNTITNITKLRSNIRWLIFTVNFCFAVKRIINEEEREEDRKRGEKKRIKMGSKEEKEKLPGIRSFQKTTCRNHAPEFLFWSFFFLLLISQNTLLVSILCERHELPLPSKSGQVLLWVSKLIPLSNERGKKIVELLLTVRICSREKIQYIIITKI